MAVGRFFPGATRRISKKICVMIMMAVVCFSGCGLKKNIYTRENIASEIETILKNEYDLNSIVKLEDNTVGICVTLPKIFSGNKDSMPLLVDQFQNITYVMKRVLFSTDFPLEFYQITFRGLDSNFEIVLNRYGEDLRGVINMRFSFEDYSKRMLYKNYLNLAKLGNERLREFFQDFGRESFEKIVGTHFSPKASLKKIPSAFISQILEGALKKDVRFEFLDMRMKSVSDQFFLFYVKLREFFEMKHPFESTRISTHSGMEQAYVFGISYTDFGVPKIESVQQFTDDDVVQKQLFEQEYGPVDSWLPEDFYLEKMDLGTFLGGQIASRIQSEIEKENPSKLSFVRSIVENNVIKLLFFYKDPQQKNVAATEENISLKTVKDVCQSYRFKGFESIHIGTVEGVMKTHSFS